MCWVHLLRAISREEGAMARGDPPISLEALVPYYNGAYFATVALKGRLGKLGPDGRAALHEVSDYQQMVVGFREAIQRTIELKRDR
jgi:hypothetical protein